MGQWHFDQVSGTGSASTTPDSSPAGGTGHFAGAPALTSGGRFGSALDLAGAPQPMTVSSPGVFWALEPRTAISVTAWIKRLGSPGLLKYIIGKGGTSAPTCGGSSYAIYTGYSPGNEGLQFYVVDTAGAGHLSPRVIDDSTVWDGSWHAVTGTYDGATVRFYVDGAQVGTGTPATGAIGYTAYDFSTFAAGTYADGGGCGSSNFTGAVDEVRIHNRALSAFEIAKLHDAAATTPPDLTPPAPRADLRLTLSTTPATPVVGAPLTYTMTLRNAGPDAAPNPRASLTLPAGLTYRNATGSCTHPSATRVTCGIASLASGATTAWGVTVVPQREATFRARASATSGATDPSPANAADTDSRAAKLPKPKQNRTVIARPVSGTVLIKKNGKFVRLKAGQAIPIGSEIGTLHGRIRLTSAAGGGKTQTADFFEGRFKLGQTKGKKPVTTLKLTDPVGPCPKASSQGPKKGTSARKKKKRKRKSRHLWGSGKGRFRTSGRFGSATVRGTTWLTSDTCAGTRVTVKRGVVAVRDVPRNKTVTVRAGRSYLAGPKTTPSG